MASSYTAKDITVLEGLEPVRKRPGMYIGGVGAAGLHHLVWEILDNAVDEAMNGYASNIGVTLHEDGSSITIDRRWPRHPGRQASEDQEERARSDLHGAPRRRQVRAGQLQDGRRPARRRRERRQRAVEGARRHACRRDGAQWEMSFKRGKPTGAAQEGRARRAAAARPSTSIPTRRSSRRSSSIPAVIRERLEIVSYIHKGVKVTFENEADEDEGDLQHEEGIVRLPEEDRRASAAPSRCTTRRSSLDARERRRGWTSCCSGPKSTDEHLRSYVNGIPTGSGGTHENGLRAGLGKAVRNYIDTHNLSPKGVTLTAEDIREGLIGVLSVFIEEPQFQGQTKDRLNNPEVLSAVDSARAAGARALAESQHQRRRGDRRAHHPRGARTRGEPRGAGRRSRARAPRRPARICPAS